MWSKKTTAESETSRHLKAPLLWIITCSQLLHEKSGTLMSFIYITTMYSTVHLGLVFQLWIQWLLHQNTIMIITARQEFHHKPAKTCTVHKRLLQIPVLGSPKLKKWCILLWTEYLLGLYKTCSYVARGPYFISKASPTIGGKSMWGTCTRQYAQKVLMAAHEEWRLDVFVEVLWVDQEQTRYRHFESHR